MKHINLDREDDRIKAFVRSLPVDPDGSLLELGGAPVLRVMPVEESEVDIERLKEAIVRRRDASRVENDQWQGQHCAEREPTEMPTCLDSQPTVVRLGQSLRREE